MRWTLPGLRRGAAVASVAACLWTVPGQGHAQVAPDCGTAARATEQASGLPDRLLLAIGRAESGRYDPATRTTMPWPWTVNAQGIGHYFASRDEATGFVRGLQAQGVRSIDVGCFQVNLLYHPGAFASLEDAFDPQSNAAYAGRFLLSLHARSGSWESAVAFYHSAAPVEGEAYRRRVYASLDGVVPPAGTLTPYAFARHTDDPVVVLMSAAAARVTVVTPMASRVAVVTPAAARLNDAGPVLARVAGGMPPRDARPQPGWPRGRALPRIVVPLATG